MLVKDRTERAAIPMEENITDTGEKDSLHLSLILFLLVLEQSQIALIETVGINDSQACPESIS